MKPFTVTNSAIFRHLPRFLSLEVSFKYGHFPTESSNSMKSYAVNVMRNQDRTGAQNQHYVHRCSAHIKIPVIWMRSFQISFSQSLLTFFTLILVRYLADKIRGQQILLVWGGRRKQLHFAEEHGESGKPDSSKKIKWSGRRKGG